MFGVFLDESFDPGRDGLFVVAAVLGDGWRVLKGETLWRQLLKENGLPSFKASRLRQRPELVARFAQVISDAELVTCGIIARYGVVSRYLTGSKFDRQYTQSPYLHLHHEIFVDIAETLRKRGAAHSASFVCDENARYLEILSRSYPVLKDVNPKAGGYMGSCTTERDEDCIPLQMADLVASEFRKAGDAWNPETLGLSAALRVLLDRNTVWKVNRLGDERMRAVRDMIDAR